jgi:integrase/recombinase XerD
MVRRLLRMLRRTGAIPPAKVQVIPAEELAHDFRHFLSEERGLAPGSVEQYGMVADRFLSAKYGDDRLTLSKLTAPDVTLFVKRHAHRHSPWHARGLVKAMRSFLRYLYYKQLVETDLSHAVPKVAFWSFSTLPKYLSTQQVCQVLRRCNRTTPLGRRDYAILLLLARLGLRAGEVVRLNLEDVDWENARITVVGKGQKPAQLPLPADAGKAIAAYLRHDRPCCASRRLFICASAPVRGFGATASVSDIVKRALAKAGVVVPGRKGAHLLRHGLATDMLRKGASLDEIGEVLRHKSRETTAIYAKVDLESLRALAVPWPGGTQ